MIDVCIVTDHPFGYNEWTHRRQELQAIKWIWINAEKKKEKAGILVTLYGSAIIIKHGAEEAGL